MQITMKNYKTTLAGLIGAICIALEPVVQKIITGGTIDWSGETKNIIGAVVVAALGYFAKDHDVTGGTRPQNP